MRVRDGKRYSQQIAKSGEEEHLSFVIVHGSFVIGPEIA
jgi:hypothetical protein